VQTPRLLRYASPGYAAGVNPGTTARPPTPPPLPARRRAIVVGSCVLSLTLPALATPSPTTPGPRTISFQPSVQARLRYEIRDAVGGGSTTPQLLLRGVVGGEVRASSGWRGYGELAAGEVATHRPNVGANLRNALAVQQLWLEAPWSIARANVTARLGRQEFDAGPRQLLSVGDGPNLHRTWNGARLDGSAGGVKLRVFALRATQLGRRGFDERVNRTERLSGATASVALPRLAGAWHLDPFWLRTEKSGATRETWGMRLWGRRGGLTIDWTAAGQNGLVGDRAVGAWALFASQSWGPTEVRWQPRLGLRIDLASGDGGSAAPRRMRGFDPLYASSSYLGEGLFLSASNLFLVTPGFSCAPTPRTKVALDYGFARRLDARDAAYAGQMRAYPGTRAVGGHELGGLLRVLVEWSATPRVSLGLDYEHLSRGDVLVRAHLPARRYAHASVSFRY
jgi:hypothetical protein